ncbi:hypothetical protein CCZ01_08890 [Helicobacter monodelphidis]|uniref:DUF4145 domain-containing protein n=1 Tax=Helicobacter sp. 15-1451 TaxID=2004995 RepID=UPI000DCD518D|nr:DUF4145 domain-containing protein [Helicobacter sp. 15-1451]RAX56643.1 hypothetical protein CCZ01_08890 [Helicobacter sp. 15-1451]
MNNEKFIAPQFDLNTFTCPHCQVVAQMDFFIPNKIEREIIDKIAEIKYIMNDSLACYHLNKAESERLENRIETITEIMQDYRAYANTFCVCQSCNEISIWIDKKIVYPKPRLAPLPNEDLPDNIKADYVEASLIVQDSPRGACALLRLALQKLMIHLGEDKNLNKAIQSLIDKKRIDENLQKALDFVRVVGNIAVHPSELDIKDNQEIAIALFKIINYIAEKILTDKRQIDEIYNLLPENAKRENRQNK